MKSHLARRFFSLLSSASLATTAFGQTVAVSSQVQVAGPISLATPIQRVFDGPSTTFHGDMRRSGHYKNWTGPRVANLLWQSSVSSAAGFGYAQPVVGGNGTIYIKDLADVLYAVSPLGIVLWQLDLGPGSTGSGFPPADSTITIYKEKISGGAGLFFIKERLLVTTGDAQLRKISTNGVVLWSVQMPRASTSCSVAVHTDGMIYASSYDFSPPFDGTLGVYDQAGNLAWELDTLGLPAINGAPSLDAAGNVTLNGFSNATKYDASGNGPIWDFLSGFHIYGSIAQDTQGRSYFGSGDGNLYALETDGSLLWSLPAGFFVTSTPAVTNDRVIVGSWDGGVYASSLSGNPVWTFFTGSSVESSPIVDSQGYTYVVSTDGELYCLDPNGQLVFQATVGGGSIGTVAPGKGGRLYVTSASGDLMVFVP